MAPLHECFSSSVANKVLFFFFFSPLSCNLLKKNLLFSFPFSPAAFHSKRSSSTAPPINLPRSKFAKRYETVILFQLCNFLKKGNGNLVLFLSLKGFFCKLQPHSFMCGRVQTIVHHPALHWVVLAIFSPGKSRSVLSPFPNPNCEQTRRNNPRRPPSIPTVCLMCTCT